MSFKLNICLLFIIRYHKKKKGVYISLVKAIHSALICYCGDMLSLISVAKLFVEVYVCRVCACMRRVCVVCVYDVYVWCVCVYVYTYTCIYYKASDNLSLMDNNMMINLQLVISLSCIVCIIAKYLNFSCDIVIFWDWENLKIKYERVFYRKSRYV